MTVPPESPHATVLDAINPRSGEVDYQFEVTEPPALGLIANRLRQAQAKWAADSSFRVEALDAWADAMESRATALADALSLDTGRRLLSHVEVQSMAGRIRYWTRRFPDLLAPAADGRSSSAANVSYRHQLVPYPLVGVISPWNFPLTLSLVDTIPALCAGCAVLLKPSEVTPRFTTVLKQTIAEVPALSAVLEVVLGGARTGQAVIDNVDMICFTGSVESGRKVAIRAAENFIPACLELGGKDPAIVLEDACIDAAADAILRSAAGSSGQACMSIERIYVHSKHFEEFRDALITRSRKLSFNTPDPDTGCLPPFIDQRQARKVAEQLEDALARGAILHCGGLPSLQDGGYWMAPAVLTNISNEMLLMKEETFGPLLPLIAFETDEEALSLANASEYGLSGSIFGAVDHAAAVAAGLNVGAVGINDASMTALIHDVEKQSFGVSGLGPSRMGDMGLMRFLRRKALLIQHDRPLPLSAFDESAQPG